MAKIKIQDYINNVESCRKHLINTLNNSKYPTHDNASLYTTCSNISDLMSYKSMEQRFVDGLEEPITDDGYLVRWIDADGRVLKREYVKEGQSATPPNNPTFDSEHLIFTEWTSTSDWTNVKYPIDCGAVYDTIPDIDGKYWTIIKVLVRKSSLTISLNCYLGSSTKTPAIIDWGDGVMEEFSKTSVLTHTYDSQNYYYIRIWRDSVYCISTTSSVSPYDMMRRLYLGENAQLCNNSYNYLYIDNLEILSIGTKSTLIKTPLKFCSKSGNGCATHLKAIIYPKQIDYDAIEMSAGSYSGKLYKNNISSIRSFNGSTFGNIKYIVIPDSVKTVSSFKGCTARTLVLPPDCQFSNSVAKSLDYSCISRIINCPLITIHANDYFNSMPDLCIPIELGDDITQIKSHHIPVGTRILRLPPTLTYINGDISRAWWALETLEISENFDMSLSLPRSAKLSIDSLVGISKNLKNNVGSTAKTLTLNIMCYKKMQETFIDSDFNIVDISHEDASSIFDVILNKNWTLAYNDQVGYEIPAGFNLSSIIWAE